MNARGASLAGRLEAGGRWLRRRLLDPDYPLLAVEVRARALGVVRLARQKGQLALASAASLELPEGTLRLSMTEPNLADAPAFRAVLRAALERAGALTASRAALVLPDPVARVALLPAAEVMAKRGREREELLRFKLRKSVPFEIRDARLALSPLPPRPGTEPAVLVAAVCRPVLEAYESALAEAGLHAGLVELTGLALHEATFAASGEGDRLLVNWDHGYVSFVLSRGGTPVLVRTLAGELSGSAEEVVREAAATAFYHRDRLGGAALQEAAVRCAQRPADEAAALLAEPLGVTPRVLDPFLALGAAVPRAEDGQALAGAAACAIARAA